MLKQFISQLRLPHRIPGSALALVFLVGGLSACGGGSIESVKPLTEREAARLEANQLYTRARDALDSSDFLGALNVYSQLEARYPFSEQARQAQLESTYAQYRLRQWDVAAASAERFIGQYPRHPNVEYAYYLKGLAIFGRATEDVGGFLATDGARRNPGPAREGFFAFNRLINQFPNSIYAADAQQRMRFLRERLARHELYVVRFYLKRRAWLGAANRAKAIVEEFQGTEVVPEALRAMETAYIKLGLSQLATDASRVLRETYPRGSRQSPVERPGDAIQPPPGV